jgi:dTDP-4-dehydrorhamnose 3,5-epimerase
MEKINNDQLHPKFEISDTTLDGVKRVDYKVFPDNRGSVMEAFRLSDYEASGLPSLGERPQVNLPRTIPGAIRGIHAEFAHKFVSVASGKIYAAIVDLRTDKDTFGDWEGFELDRGQGLFIPSGFGNSFECLEECVYCYIFSEEWYPGMPGLACNPLDEELNIDWKTPRDNMILSNKDLANPSLSAIRNLGKVATNE